MHSYGGQVGTNACTGLSISARAAAGKPVGVSHLIYVAAFAQSPGKGMVDKVREFDHEQYMDMAFDFAADKTVLPRDPSYLIGATPGLTQEEVDAYTAAMVKTRWNGNCMYGPIEACAWRKKGIKVAYLVATKDACVPEIYQRSMIEGMEKEGVKVGVWEVESGHCPAFTNSEDVVKALGEIVGAKGKDAAAPATTAAAAIVSTGVGEGE
ncbi:hypothetical protein K458DRAFT_415570 [Lentithecium fluviatile CBS 122367]|uniref:AB hydrolase-1 domain-containing protein n=1 Tax=Lentithecium fluviatile CBS 122367 TaxID=1168545 RepID=A0A6G1J9T2_9PLEO|nr:hypothetical protein K458DRAFT_415570 [Lentithecium fluviatile CBS 122367]